MSGLKQAEAAASASSGKISGALINAGKNIESLGKSMSTLGKNMTKYFTLPVVAGVVASVKAFADLEQAIGGVETLFKGSAKKVIQNSETAYKRAGVSGVMYMQQATSFSASLLQGLGGDTEKAAQIADMAMVDMADNANKFGTNISMIQNAYQGFARENFMMLDNLKLGYGGTATEMARLINETGILGKETEVTAESVRDVPFSDIIKAINIVQERLGITGTTAKEASTTVTGSFMSMKAAFMNLLAGYGSSDADIKLLTKNLLDTFKTFAGNVKQVLLTIWDNLPISDETRNLVESIFTSFVDKIKRAVDAISGLWSKIPDQYKELAAMLLIVSGPALSIAGKLTQGLGSVVGASGSAIKALAGMPPQVLAVVAVIALLTGAVITLWNTNEDFKNSVIKIWEDFKASFAEIEAQLLEVLAELGWNFETIGEAIKAAWLGMCDFLAPILEETFAGILAALQTILGGLVNAFNFFADLFRGDWEGAWESLKGFFIAIWDGLGQWLVGILQIMWENLKTFVANIGQFIADFAQAAVKLAMDLGKKFIDAVISFFKQLPGMIAGFLRETLPKIVSWAADMGAKAVQAGQSFLNGVINFIMLLPGRVLGFLKDVVTKVASWAFGFGNEGGKAGDGFVKKVISFITQLPSKVFNLLKTVVTRVGSFALDLGRKGLEAGTGLIKKVIDGAKQIIPQLPSIGAEIVRGVWSGISGAIGTFYTNIRNFFKGAVDNVKKELGIKSPSTVFRDQVGKMIMSGLKSGIDSGRSGVSKAIKTVTDNVKKEALKAYQEFSKQMKDLQEEYNDTLKDMRKTNKETLKSLKQETADALKSIKKSFDDTINSIAKSESSMMLSIANFAGYFTAPKKNEAVPMADILKNAEETNKQLLEFEAQLKAILSKNIPQELKDFFMEMSPADVNQLKEFNAMTEEQTARYVALIKQRNDLGMRIAKQFYADERALAKDEYNKEIAEENLRYKNAVEQENIRYQEQLVEEEARWQKRMIKLKERTAKDMDAVGRAMKDGLKNGTKLTDKEINKVVDNLVGKVIKQTKKMLGIKSPSRVFKDQIGKMIPLGMVEGVISAIPNAFRTIGQAINNGIDNLKINDVMVGVGSTFDDASMAYNTGTLGYVSRGGIDSNRYNSGYLNSNQDDRYKQSNDTFIFNSPKAIDEVEASRLLRNTKRQLVQGFI